VLIFGGANYWREFYVSKMVRLKFGGKFASETAATEGMWVQGGGNKLPCKIPSTSSQEIPAQ